MFGRFLIGFQRITAKDIASANVIEYIPSVTNMEIHSYNKSVNMFQAIDNRYILLYPPNDGMPTYPFEWYGIINGSSQLIIDNRSAFKCISNLDNIIFQIIKLFEKYIDKNVFISADGFAIKLSENPCHNYQGKASLVLTKDSICNNKVKLTETIEAKKYFINDFLDHYICWNFGEVIKNNPYLEDTLIDFNNLVVNKGLREHTNSSLEIWKFDDIMHYTL